MRKMLLTTSALAALAFGSNAALAQSQSGTPTASPSSQPAQSASNAMPKAMSQDKARQVMKDAGFTNVQILDATYLVQASTKDGDQILVVLNPPMMSRSGAPATTGATAGGSSSTSGSTTSGNAAPAPKQ
jgi:hypothetical protein